MDRIDKIKMAIDKGIEFNRENGKIYGVRGNEIKPHKNGYIKITMTNNKKVVCLQGHHFVWYLEYGEVPDYIDHIDGSRSNNKIENLRSVTMQENSFNRKNVTGVSYHKGNKMYRAHITYNNKYIHLGYFNNLDDAKSAYMLAKAKYHNIKNKKIKQ
jgi:hypothetical protein